MPANKANKPTNNTSAQTMVSKVVFHIFISVETAVTLPMSFVVTKVPQIIWQPFGKEWNIRLSLFKNQREDCIISS